MVLKIAKHTTALQIQQHLNAAEIPPSSG